MKRIVVLGATGSVGRSTLDVVKHHKDRFKIVGLAVGENVSLLEAQCHEYSEAKFTVCSEQAHEEILKLNSSLEKRSSGYGDAAILGLIDETSPDLVLNAFVGFVGLRPALYCLEHGIDIALANKETVVAGGEILVKASKSSGAAIIPVDSEHVAISQCLKGHSIAEVKKVYLTASGGALRNMPVEQLENARIEEVLSHPTWKMGDRITVDSATMLNKGLEVIEAQWLFGLPLEKIAVMIHPQSIIHSLVEYTDGSIIAQMGIPDMRLPILYALSYPERIESDIVPSKIDEFPELTFKSVDIKRYPCLRLALEAARCGGNAPSVLIAANEIAVDSFLKGKISFSMIGNVIESSLAGVPHSKLSTIEDVIETAASTSRYVEERFRLNNKRYTWSWSC